MLRGCCQVFCLGLIRNMYLLSDMAEVNEGFRKYYDNYLKSKIARIMRKHVKSRLRRHLKVSQSILEKYGFIKKKRNS
jgi:hypothetical protein